VNVCGNAIIASVAQASPALAFSQHFNMMKADMAEDNQPTLYKRLGGVYTSPPWHPWKNS